MLYSAFDLDSVFSPRNFVSTLILRNLFIINIFFFEVCVRLYVFSRRAGDPELDSLGKGKTLKKRLVVETLREWRPGGGGKTPEPIKKKIKPFQ